MRHLTSFRVTHYVIFELRFVFVLQTELTLFVISFVNRIKVTFKMTQCVTRTYLKCHI